METKFQHRISCLRIVYFVEKSFNRLTNKKSYNRDIYKYSRLFLDFLETENDRARSDIGRKRSYYLYSMEKYVCLLYKC